MRSVVLDTHALTWYLSLPKKLGARAKRALTQVERGQMRGFIPAIVVVELVLLQESGRRVAGPKEIERLVAEQVCFEVLQLDATQASEFALLPNLVDPFDRLIVAAARSSRSTLLTADERIAASNLVEVLW